MMQFNAAFQIRGQLLQWKNPSQQLSSFIELQFLTAGCIIVIIAGARIIHCYLSGHCTLAYSQLNFLSQVNILFQKVLGIFPALPQADITI